MPQKTALIWDTDHEAIRRVAADLAVRGYRVWCAGECAPGTQALSLGPLDEGFADELTGRFEGGSLSVLVIGLPARGANDAPIGGWGRVGEGMAGCRGSEGEAGDQASSGCRDYDALLSALEGDLAAAMALLRAALPLLRAGEKRIAVLSNPGASIALCDATRGYAGHMASAALNMLEKIWFNALRPEGFTFRNFALGGQTGMSAAEYLDRDLCYDADEPYIHSDENRLVMRDGRRVEIPW